MPRGTDLNEKVQAKIVEALRAGNTRRAAAAYAGIGESTFHEWLQRGRGQHPERTQEPIFAAFAEAVEKAEADSEVAHVALIHKAAREGQWTASAWWLERRRPDDYGRKVAIKDESAWTPLTDRELQEMREALRRPELAAADRDRLKEDLRSGDQKRVLKALSELGVRG